MLITAAMIVKNEEPFLDGCLGSIAGLADEVVVVDTGSTDRSKEIARRHRAKVADFAWCDDFAEARNAALDLAGGDWILYIDADERVRPGSSDQVRAQLKQSTAAGEYVLLHPRIHSTAYRVLRLFRNHPSIRFEGVIHETIWPSLDRYRERTQRGIGTSALVLDHFGYEANQERKHVRNLPLLQRAVQDNPLRIYAWSHLADTYLALGNEEMAEQTWQRAIGIIRESASALSDAHLPFLGLIQHQLAKQVESHRLLNEARERFPENLQFVWLEGQSLVRQEQFQRAIPLFEKLTVFRSVEAPGDTQAYDRKLFDVQAFSALALCHFRLRDFGESRRYYRMLCELEPESLEYRAKSALCSRLEFSL
jgi:tetratricopeptide (TPR) repeat protein